MDVTDARIQECFKKLKMPEASRQFKVLAKESCETDRTYEEYILTLLLQEIENRETNRIKRLVSGAKFPLLKTLDTFDFKAVPDLNKPRILKLMQCMYIEKKENVIFIGSSGTGKTHLATTLSYAACRSGFSVRFYTAANLANELLEAQQEYRIKKLEKQWIKYDLVVIDELGYIPFDRMSADLMFQFCSLRSERGSIVITTNREFQNWSEVFGDGQLTVALLDRLTFNAHIIPMNGESYRFKQSLKSNNTI